MIAALCSLLQFSKRVKYTIVYLSANFIKAIFTFSYYAFVDFCPRSLFFFLAPTSDNTLSLPPLVEADDGQLGRQGGASAESQSQRGAFLGSSIVAQ